MIHSCFFLFSKGYHNYHHVFPFDYSASELTWKHDLNLSTLFIEACAWLGLAYNLKKVDEKVIKSRVLRTGDQSLNLAYTETRSGKMRWITILTMFYTFLIIPTAIYLIRISLFSWLFSHLLFCTLNCNKIFRFTETCTKTIKLHSKIKVYFYKEKRIKIT